MFILKSAPVEALTPELVEKHLNMTPMPGERPLRPGRLVELDGYLHAGTFNNPVWAIAVPKGTTKEYRADGHHTALALQKAAREGRFPVGCVGLIVYYEIDSLKEDAAELFLRFDDSDAVRNSVATMNSLATGYRDLHGVNPSFIVAVMKGLVYHLNELNRQQKDPASRATIYRPKLRGVYLAEKSYRVFTLWFNHWNTLKSEKTGEPRKALNDWLMKKPPVVAEAMTDYFQDSEVARIFWDYALDDKGPNGQPAPSEHPVKELVSRLNNWRSKSKGDIPKPDQWRKAVRKCWTDFLSDYKAGKGRRK